MDWTTFSFDFQLKEPFTTELVSIDGYRRAVERLLIPAQWKNELNRLNRIRAIHGTTAIEGNRMSEEQVGSFLEESTEDEVSNFDLSIDEREVHNAKLAQDWVRERLNSQSQRTLQLGDVLHIHHLVTAGAKNTENIPGQLRSHSVTVGSKELGGVHLGAPHESLRDLMSRYFKWLYSRELSQKYHPVVRALVAHYFLVTIHPFGDGNGRVSRLVEAYLLLQAGYNIHGFYGLSNFFYQNADDYRNLLQRSRRTTPFNLTEFVGFGLKGFELELAGINRFIQARQNRVFYLDTLKNASATKISPRRYVLSRREYDFLTYMVEKTDPVDPFSPTQPRRIELPKLISDPFVERIYRDVSTRTVQRDISRLEEKGFIRISDEEGNKLISIDLEAIERY